MGRPKVHESNADRQRAWREKRKRETTVVNRNSLANLNSKLEMLQNAIADAAAAGDKQSRNLQAASVDTMLEKLIFEFSKRAPQKVS